MLLIRIGHRGAAIAAHALLYTGLHAGRLLSVGSRHVAGHMIDAAFNAEALGAGGISRTVGGGARDAAGTTLGARSSGRRSCDGLEE